MAHGKRQKNEGKALMGKRHHQRHVHDKRENAENRLRDSDPGNGHGLTLDGGCCIRTPNPNRVNQHRDHQQVGCEPVVELDSQHVLKEVEVHGLHQKQAIGDKLSVHQRPGRVGEPGVETGNESTQNDLEEDENEDRSCGP